jgi:hypothetical protein
MNLLCLNSRGCGRSATVQEIRSLVVMHRPSLVFLSETKMSDRRSQDLRLRLGFDHAFGVKSEGLSGGLVLFWNSDSVVSLKSFSQSHIDVMIKNDVMGDGEWRFTGFYGNPVRTKRRRNWELMKYLRRESDNPWICAGDFNEVLCASEQYGGNDRQEWMMEGFREAVDYCRFTDLGFSGLPYTWNNKQQAPKNIKVRLDRALGDERFMDIFDNTSVRHVQTTESDHCCLLISISRSDWLRGGADERPFRFENMWVKHDRYSQVVEGSWQAGAQTLLELNDELGRMQRSLQTWSKQEFGSVKKQLKMMRERLECIRADSLRSGPTREECDLMKKISDLLAREESMMKQRSRVQWLAEGDRNTTFFSCQGKRACENK